ncbi:MAG: PD-(D/E)XK motif protein [Hyphomicrobium sp.]|jgi:hypothetical protein
MSDALGRILAQLGGQTPPQGAFNALPIPDYPAHYLGVSDDGCPCLMLHAHGAGGGARHPLRLQGLSIQYYVPCRLVIPDGQLLDRSLTTLLCTSRDALERRYFLYAADLVLRILGPEPSLTAVVSATAHLARMFQMLSRPAPKPLTGLIGELLFILRSAAPPEAVMAWRNTIDDTFDFAADDLRVEVKATQGRSRLHYLSYDQCHPPGGTIGILASVIVESSGGGTSVAELMREIEAALAGRHDALMRLHEIFAETLGNAAVTALEERFDRQLAEESLLLFDMSEVPAVRGALPPAVSQVRFRADLSACAPRPSTFFQARSRSAARLLPG